MAGALACAVVAWLARSHKGACVALALVATALGILAAVALRMYMGDFATSAFTQVSSMSSPAGRL
jgi:predicted membrane protein